MSLDTDSGAYGDVYAQYVEVAAHLWLRREIAVNRPDFTARNIEALDRRVEAQLDGLMTSVDEGWSACEAALALAEPGEVFTAAVVAIRSHDVSRIRMAVEHGLANPITVRGLISALGWLPTHLANPWIEKLLNGKDLNHKFLGVAACSLRRQDPGAVLADILTRPDCLQHENLHARALRLVGELRRQDLMPAVMRGASAGSDAVRFWSTWAAVMLGHRAAAEQLRPYVVQLGPWQPRAIQLAFRVLPILQARQWISEMAKDGALERQVVAATGVLGDPHAVNWLIDKMRNPKLARVAVEAFCTITGADAGSLTSADKPHPGWTVGPNEDPADPNIALDDDEHLAWPDPQKASALWQRIGSNFIVGQRYFLGRPLTIGDLKDTVVNGYQRHRHAAAMELALSDWQTRLINTKARTLPYSSPC